MQQRRQACARARVWAGPRSLAATSGISVDFSSSGYLDVSVPRVAVPRPMCSAGGGRVLPRPGSPIRRSAGQRVCAPRRGLSQLATSFLVFLCLGIHRAPLISSSTFFHLLLAHFQRLRHERHQAIEIGNRNSDDGCIIRDLMLFATDLRTMLLSRCRAAPAGAPGTGYCDSRGRPGRTLLLLVKRPGGAGPSLERR